ncbi:hypothetical protein OHC33_009174 [Knufia fluminis]|uniref:Uncharacterized protein n=1 Tax=Knufia fluminis TaxID=191047 RepID=A0AAN8EHL1_9EURO|nr:hypothetical protein OHC33_009174 [Knufia fluminis]
MTSTATDGPAHTPIWTSETSLELPNTDIVSFAFGKLGTYDLDKPIFIDAEDTSRFVTAAQARDATRKLCKGLQESGLKPRECVTICSFNHVSSILCEEKEGSQVTQVTRCQGNGADHVGAMQILYPCLWLGVIGAGGVVAGVNPALTVSELKHHLTVTGTRYLIVHETCFKHIAPAAAGCGIGTDSIYVFTDDLLAPIEEADDSASDSHDSDGVLPDTQSEDNSTVGSLQHPRRLKDILRYGSAPWRTLEQDETATCTPAVHATTSGTTGLPKAAVIPHRYLVSQSVMLENQYASREGKISQLITLPVFHLFAGNAAFVLPLRCGIPTYFLPRFRLDEYVSALDRFQITDTLVVPPIISSLVLQGEGLGNKLHSLRRLICAGAPMNPEVQKKLYNYLSPEARISQCWGTTETGWVTLTPVKELDQSGSVGRLTANTQLKIVSTGGLSGHGEALVKSPSIFLGYRENPSANESSFDSEGYYRTGDRAYFKDGKVFIEGRIKDVMKVNGWQVSPEELEEKIQAHPKVVDCAVVGHVSTDRAGLEEVKPRAYVVLKEGSRADADDICTWVNLRTASYKHLKGGVFFVDSIPRNASGKILRRLLLDGD